MIFPRDKTEKKKEEVELAKGKKKKRKEKRKWSYQKVGRFHGEKVSDLSLRVLSYEFDEEE